MAKTSIYYGIKGLVKLKLNTRQNNGYYVLHFLYLQSSIYSPLSIVLYLQSSIYSPLSIVLYLQSSIYSPLSIVIYLQSSIYILSFIEIPFVLSKIWHADKHPQWEKMVRGNNSITIQGRIMVTSQVITSSPFLL